MVTALHKERHVTIDTWRRSIHLRDEHSIRLKGGHYEKLNSRDHSVSRSGRRHKLAWSAAKYGCTTVSDTGNKRRLDLSARDNTRHYTGVLHPLGTSDANRTAPGMHTSRTVWFLPSVGNSKRRCADVGSSHNPGRREPVPPDPVFPAVLRSNLEGEADAERLSLSFFLRFIRFSKSGITGFPPQSLL